MTQPAPSVNENTAALADSLLVPTYARGPLVIDRGEGVWLYDDTGRRYLDFGAGIAVMALGHSDPEWVATVREQAGRLTHVSNLYHTHPQTDLAARLVTHSFADRVFFGNTGAEANEAAFKFARKWARQTHGPDKFEIVAFTGSFHGRTMATVATTWKAAYREPFAPLIPGVRFAAFNDLAAAREAIGPATCAVIVEPVQGEGGVLAASPEFLEGLRGLCNQADALLIFDEVQCGLGRTGRLWAHEAWGVTPDIMTLAKPLAGGLPIGAVLVTQRVASAIGPGDHGSTFACGPLVAAAACTVFDRIRHPDFLAQVRRVGEHLLNRLRQVDSPRIAALRGSGLFVGLELDRPVKGLLAAAQERGLLAINAGERVIRLCPPLVVNEAQVDQAVDILAACLRELD
ncbi:MAG: aspartate aminotransferase family protein [Ardenticatenia bacterium]|nr:aspartate aminotransferase family protein [Ardenticatenia bacterium]